MIVPHHVHYNLSFLSQDGGASSCVFLRILFSLHLNYTQLKPRQFALSRKEKDVASHPDRLLSS